LAACTTPPQPTAITAAATIRRRQVRIRVELQKAVVSMAIGNALNPVF
jgi:hypothetical protein